MRGAAAFGSQEAETGRWEEALEAEDMLDFRAR